MKVIDLLNKIANGEIPKKIVINDRTYTHDGIDYKREDDGEYLFEVFLEITTEDFNREVEIIEEDKKIEKIDLSEWSEITYSEDWKMLERDFNRNACCFVNKINEIIDKINSMEEK